ncbi:ATP-binding cassette domain-containing protein [Emticicia sp. W12TSBA100-4]|uniref:ABC transporter ATP-binding protein n=1 Tax=Emticicia sp. W12TSBA100-4 TaxID=3160965 RepID=UPI003305DBCB
MQLSFTNYRKAFGAVEVLNINDLTLESGIYWVKGENGSGKSTLFKSIAGIIDFDGNIELNKSLNSQKQTVEFRKMVNFAEAEPLFPEFLTGKDLINLFSEAKNAPPSQSEFYLNDMKMQTYINEPVGAYSSGMLKKLSIVLAFLGKPQLILLDEPLITLDTYSLKILYKWIEKKFVEDGVSFLISSHQPLGFDSGIATKTLLVENRTLNFA